MLIHLALLGARGSRCPPHPTPPHARSAHRLRALVLVSLLSPGVHARTTGDWSRRLRHVERRLSEPDLAAVTVALTRKLVLVSDPFVPSYCEPERLVRRGGVTAFRRADGALLGRAPMPQASHDQSAFLDAYTWRGRIVFATNGVLTGFAGRLRRRWKRRSDPGRPCHAGPFDHIARGDVRQARRRLVWHEAGLICRLDLLSGKIDHGPWPGPMTPDAYPPRPSASPPRVSGEDVHLLGHAADRLGRVQVIARCETSPCTVHVRHRQGPMR